MAVTVDFCGEIFQVSPDQPFDMGREGDLILDENPYMHRRFLRISTQDGLWWLHNIGTQLSATVSDADGLMQAWLSPGGTLPLVFARTMVWFTAGPTTYEVEIIVDEPSFAPSQHDEHDDGTTTIGRVTFTPSQHLLMVALAEPLLRNGGRGTSARSPQPGARRSSSDRPAARRRSRSGRSERLLQGTPARRPKG